MSLLLDTNVLIPFLRRQKKAVHYLATLSKQNRNISIINAAEVLQGAHNRNELVKTQEILNEFNIIPVSNSISLIALELITKHALTDGLLITDALIASTSIRYNLTLVTSNLKHFQKINGLKIQEVRF